MRNDDALNDISLDAEPTKEKELLSAQRREILFNFLARMLFPYLPLSVYFIVNIPYFTIPPQDDQPFLKGLFLPLFITSLITLYCTNKNIQRIKQ